MGSQLLPKSQGVLVEVMKEQGHRRGEKTQKQEEEEQSQKRLGGGEGLYWLLHVLKV